jgi:hypothetical protein
VDVTHFVYRMLKQCSAAQYLSNSERFALLVSATCHDIGHPGFNNTVLVEAQHEIAAIYNDKSSLENYHCSRLFARVTTQRCNIFSKLQKKTYVEVRKVCIEAILHTDNSYHFGILKEIQMMYEVHAHALHDNDGDVFPPRHTLEVLRLVESRRLFTKIILHVADLSYSSKPFRIACIWTQKALDEFFLQGDDELRLGLPVQPLHDRTKVNRILVQIGQIELLAFPLFFAVARVFVPLEDCVKTLIMNAKVLLEQWQKQSDPEPGDAKALTDRINRLETRYADFVASV